MIEQAFGRRRAWSVGVEEEIMLLDAETFELVPASAEVIDETGVPDSGQVKNELFASVIELTTDPCETVDELGKALRGLRRTADAAAGRLGLRLAAAGTHASAVPHRQEIADDPRYREFVEYAGVSAKRQGVNGLHVHVEMPSAEACFAGPAGSGTPAPHLVQKRAPAVSGKRQRSQRVAAIPTDRPQAKQNLSVASNAAPHA